MEGEGEAKKSQNSIKITLIGDSGVGKTCIIRRFTSDEFFSETIPTDSLSYSSKEITYNGQIVNLDVWDTAGQEKYRSLGKHFYKDSFIVILVYNITVKETFDNLKTIWLEDVNNFGEKYKVLAVVGNKFDLYENEAVTEEDAKAFAKEHGAIFMYCSAKNGTNINALFDACVKKYFEPKFHVDVVEEKKREENSLIIKQKKKKKSGEKEKKCC